MRLELESISQFLWQDATLVSRALQNYSRVFIFKALRIKDSDCLVISLLVKENLSQTINYMLIAHFTTLRAVR